MQSLDRFDYIVFSVIGTLALTMLGVVAFGNNLDLCVNDFSPTGTASGITNIRISFYSDMDRDEIGDNFRISPEVEGDTRWANTREFAFTPSQALMPGQEYEVRLAGDSAACEGGNLDEEFNFSFQVSLPKIAFLAPATSPDRNLYAYDMATGDVEQITHSTEGIVDYAVSPDGNFIAYTEYNTEGSTDIWLYDRASERTRQLTRCINSFCQNPTWHPDGATVAYERNEYDENLGFQGAVRVWQVDINSAQSTLLFDDTQITGHSPVFAPNGEALAMVSTNPAGILVFDYIENESLLVPSLQGVIGDFSSNSDRLIYPMLVRGALGDTFYTHLEMVDISNGVTDEAERLAISGDNETPVEDTYAYWRPNSNELLVSRRYLDDRYTPGTQLYLMDFDADEVTPLVVDEAYRHGAAAWSSDGQQIAVQRFNLQEQNSRPEIWLYDIELDVIQKIAEDAYLPGFLPG